MDTETLWNEILLMLEADISRASFDTWVRDTRALAYENGVLTVGVRNAYAREWLENRVWTKAMRKLVELQPEAQDLRFVVAEADDDDHDAEEASESEEDLLAEEPEPEREEIEETDEIEISADATSFYEQAVKPHRALYLPGYFRRWLPVLGPDLAWFYLGFRQAAYWKGGRGGQKSGRFSGEQIARLCGVTERTFWNRIRSESVWQRLVGLVTKGEGQRYAVAMSLPLTAADTRALARWLTDHLEACGGAQGAVEAACQSPVAELLADDPAAEAEGFAPMTIAQLLRQMFPEADLKGQAERLRMHLMPQRDQIVISLFFLEHILPWLGAGAAWVYVLLRDRCYNGAEGARDTTLVRGGYQEIAGWLGIKKPRTIYDWLREPIAQIYLSYQRSGQSGNGQWENPLTFRVLLNDVPAEIVQAAAQGDAQAIFRSGTLGLARLENAANFSAGDDFMPRFSEFCAANFSTSMPRFSEFCAANFSTSMPRFSVFYAAIFSALKLFNSDSKPLNSLSSNQPAPQNAKTAASQATEAVGREAQAAGDSDSEFSSASQETWDLDAILQRLEVNQTSRRRLREQGIAADDFVALLLQAATMRGVDPVRVAVSWSLNPQRRAAQPSPEIRVLAESPGRLRQVARLRVAGVRRRYSMAWGMTDAVESAYQRVFGDDTYRASTILSLLFGEKPLVE
jgi:hypothetical protein